MENNEKKKRIVFPFVEAGLGHIMPMKAISDAFESQYGDQVEVVRTYFFQDTGIKELSDAEQKIIKGVKGHNRHKSYGILQRILMSLAGSRTSLKFLMRLHYGKAHSYALDYMQDLNPDLVFSTHFSTHYYACEAKERGLIDAKVVGYCTDPIIGLQWDNRVDLKAVSSSLGKKKALESGRFNANQVVDIPFLIRREVLNYDKPRAYYRRELDIPENNFTILLADGAYGEGNLEKTVKELLKTDKKITVIAVCGKNEKLYNKFLSLYVPDNITFRPYGFTDKTLMLSAACDLFMGKAGASNLAEPIYFGAPAIVTFLATFVEKWICDHQVGNGCAVKETNVRKAVALALKWADDPSLMTPYVEACKKQKRCDGPALMAEILYRQLNETAPKNIYQMKPRTMKERLHHIFKKDY